jgi:hypothetical protein
VVAVIYDCACTVEVLSDTWSGRGLTVARTWKVLIVGDVSNQPSGHWQRDKPVANQCLLGMYGAGLYPHVSL